MGSVFLPEEPRGPSVIVEIPVTTAGRGRVQLPDIPQLRSTPDQRIILNGIKLVTVDVLTNGVITGFANAPVTELQKMTLTLYSEGWEKGMNIPLLFLNDMTFAASTAPHRYASTFFSSWERVDWNQSYLQLANATVTAGVPYVVMLEVQYLKLNSQGLEVKGPS